MERAQAEGFRNGGVDYAAFVAIATIGLLIPLNTMFSGIGVIVDRESGAQRELLAAPIPRPLLVLGNLLVALAVTGLQLATLIVAAVLRGIDFHTTPPASSGSSPLRPFSPSASTASPRRSPTAFPGRKST